jgi:hypothetical protein
LLQAAGGTLPVIKKDERGVFVIVEGGGEHSHAKPAPAKPAAAAPPKASTPAEPKPAAAAPVAPAAKTEHKAGAQPNRQLFKRSTYAGVTDTGPVPGETFEQKVARLKALSGAAKQRAEEGGGPTAPAAEVPAAIPAESSAPQATEAPKPSAPPAATAAPTEHKATGNADRTLMKRGTYCGVVDTGPVPGETFQQKVARLAALAAAAKQRAEGG